MIIYTSAKSDSDLKGILSLQKANLPSNLTNEELASQGFVTIVHSLEDLQNMNEMEAHIIAKNGDEVIAYLLAMTAASKEKIPVLAPMFEIFDSVYLNNKLISAYNYIVVGQVCVDKAFRGQGVLDDCYEAYKKTFRGKYDFAITEIALTNSRSINAHKRIGFNQLHTYAAPDRQEWSIVIWNW